MVDNDNIPETHKANQILWFALLVGPIMITLCMVQLNYQEPEFLNFNNFISNIFTAIGAGLTMISFALPNYLVRNRIEEANPSGLANKFADFRANIVFKCAMHEGPALICTILMHITQNIYFIFFVIINLLLLYTARPTIDKFKAWYKLSNEENKELDDLEFLPLLSS